MAHLKNTNISDSGFLKLPVGSTAQRPSPVAGQLRFNASANKVEFYNAAVAAWIGTPATGVVATGGNSVYDVDVEGTTYRVHVFTSTGNSTFTVTRGGEIEYLIVAGGGGGGNDAAGGGGAGGLITGTFTATSQNYTITVGVGGAAGTVRTTGTVADNGGNSSAFGLTAIGGGGGGNRDTAGAGGGSGGGGAHPNSRPGAPGTPGQGNPGGNASTNAGGGGGGSSTPGKSALVGISGDGGAGIASFLTGTITFYAGGGGGGCFSAGSIGGAGGVGGGGAGAGFNIIASPGTSIATPNTGGGGGSNGSNNEPPRPGPGGSGIVVVRYPLRQENPVVAAGKVVGDGLVLDLDFAKPTVYAGSGTTVADSRLNGITGTLVNSPIFADPRTHRSSFGFSDNNDYIEIPHDEKLSAEIFSNKRFCTLEGWVNVRAYQNWSTVINKALGGSFSNTTGPGLWITSNSLRFVFGQGVSGNPPGGSTQLIFSTTTTDKWYHLVGTADGSEMRFYVDGVLIGSTPIATNPVEENTATIVLGRRSAGSSPSLTGNIGMVRAYNRPLSATEVSQNFNATRWRFGV